MVAAQTAMATAGAIFVDEEEEEEGSFTGFTLSA